MIRVGLSSAVVLLAAAVPIPGGAEAAGDLLSRVDHVVYATPDLQAGIDGAARLLGIRATPGGRHPGRGTRNALIALGPASYLEIIGPDPEQPKPSGPRPFGIDDLTAPRIAAWAAKGTELERLVADAKVHGISFGEVAAGSRQRPDGVVLSWRYTNPQTVIADGVVPFFIDWGATPHPSRTAAQGAALLALRAEHPDPNRVRRTLQAIDIDLPVGQASRPALIATIDSPRGRVVLR